MTDNYRKFVNEHIIPKLNDEEAEVIKNIFHKFSTEKFNSYDDFAKLTPIESSTLLGSGLISINKMNIFQELCVFMSKNFQLHESNNYEFEQNGVDDENNILIKDYPNDEILKSLNLKLKPYKFQYELARLGINGVNNIVCLRTGAGKTLISAIICKYWYLKHKSENTLDRFKVAFIVPTRFLAEQQCNAFKSAFHENAEAPNTILKFIDDKATTERIAEHYGDYNILFLTAKKLANTVELDKLGIFDFSILIFDECHHTADLHPYSELMNLYYEERSLGNCKKEPLIIGLTATLGVGKGSDTTQNLAKFCANLNCMHLSNLKSEELLNELKVNIPSPNSDVIHTVECSLNDHMVYKKIHETICFISKAVNLKMAPIHIIGLPEYENYLVSTIKTAQLALNRNLTIATMYLLELNATFLRVQDFSMSDCIIKLKEFYKNEEAILYDAVTKQFRSHILDLLNVMEHVKALNVKNKKLVKLINVISENHEENSRGLLLVKTRYHTKVLTDYINNHEQVKNFIRADKLTGQGSTEEFCMTEAQQQSVIKRFRDGAINLLVATDIAQEGLDVPQCNYVIRYEFVSNEIGTVQSRGRARSNNSKCCLITAVNSLNERLETGNRLKEREMDKALKLWQDLPNDQFQKLFNEFKQKFIEIHDKRKITIQKSASQIKELCHTGTTILCRFCSIYLCNASDLAYREPSYYCKSKKFEEEKITVNHETLKFHCAHESCGKELGIYVIFKGLRVKQGYILNIKSIKFNLGNNKIESYSQWSKIPFEVRKFDD